ncbi:hypothetical protein [Micromonospora sp. NPDC049679]|uniref:hypothetical protein n=1 Tax=Micromonospora sp. NPDC049679 TaxID=3155920 RepID=UPI0033F4824B
MAKFSFVDNDILIDGVSSTKVAGTLKQAGLAESKIGEIIGFWYVGATGNTSPAPFDFVTDVQTHDPRCDVTYARSFTHADWVDGEDRVQAAATPEELGFNARFHGIENEFDAIAEQFRRLGACAAELRADLVGVVREIESKLTVLQNDIFELRREALPEKSLNGTGLGIVGSVKVGQKDAFIANVGDDFTLVEFAGSSLGGNVRTKILDPGPGLVFDPAKVRPNELIDLFAGLEDAITVPRIRELVDRPDGATVAELRATAGGLALPTGETLASVLASMPADVQLKNVPGAVDTIAAHVVGTLPAETVTATTSAVITESRLRRGSITSLRSADATGVGVDATVIGLLSGAGVDTSVGGLAGMTSTDLAGRVAGSGVQVSTEALRLAVARARVATAIRGRSR